MELKDDGWVDREELTIAESRTCGALGVGDECQRLLMVRDRKGDR